MLTLPEFSIDRIIRQFVMWALVGLLVGGGYLAFRHEHNKPRQAVAPKSTLKTIVDPESRLDGQ